MLTKSNIRIETSMQARVTVISGVIIIMITIIYNNNNNNNNNNYHCYHYYYFYHHQFISRLRTSFSFITINIVFDFFGGRPVGYVI